MSSLAVGFSGNSIRLAAISEEKKLTYISELETDFDFDREIPNHFNDQHLINELSSVIAEKIKKVPDIDSHGLSVLINTAQTFCTVIPLDMDGEEQIVSSNILWDLSMYFPEEYENFNVNYFRMGKVYDHDSIYKILILAVDKNVINFYRSIFSEFDVNIEIFDTDHFAMGKYINEFYFNKLNEPYAIFGLKPSRIDISVYDKDELKHYSYTSTGELDFKRELDKELNSLETCGCFNEIKSIFIYGESLLESVKDYLVKKYPDKEIVLLDPFDNFSIEDGVVDSPEEELLKFSSASRFAPLFGIALKELATGVQEK